MDWEKIKKRATAIDAKNAASHTQKNTTSSKTAKAVATLPVLSNSSPKKQVATNNYRDELINRIATTVTTGKKSTQKNTVELPAVMKNALSTDIVQADYNSNEKELETTQKAILEGVKSSGATRFVQGFGRGLNYLGTRGEIQDEINQVISDSKEGKAGNVLGEIAGFAIPYAGAAGKVAKGVAKLPKISKLGKTGQAIATSAATDLAIGLPLNVNYVYNKQGLKGEEALKELGKQTAIDLTVGAGIEGIGAIYRAVKGTKLKSGKVIEKEADLQSLTASEAEEVGKLYKIAEVQVEGKTQNTTVGNNEKRSINKVIEDNLPKLYEMSPVKKLTGKEFVAKPGLIEEVKTFFESIGNKVVRSDFGEVILNRRGAKDSISHGIGDVKAAAFAAVPDVIKYGKQIDFHENWKGRGYDTYLFSAPVEIDGEIKYMGALVKKDEKSNRYYLHEVIDDVKKIATNRSTGALDEGMPGDSLLNEANASVNNMISNGEEYVNNPEEVRKKLDDIADGVRMDSGRKDISQKVENFLSDVSDEGTGHYGISDVEIFSEDAINISDKGVSLTKDFFRNAEAAFKNAPEAGKIFKETITDPFLKGKKDYSVRMEEKLEKLHKTVVEKLGIKKGSKESAAVQWIGEGKKQAKNEKGEVINGEYITYTLENLKSDFGYTMKNGKKAWENILAAEKYIRGIYDGYITELDDVLRKIYPNVEENVEKIRRKAAKVELKVGDNVVSNYRGNKGKIVNDFGDGTYDVNFTNREKGTSATIRMQRDDIIDYKHWREIEDATVGKRMMARKDYFHHFNEMSKNFTPLEAITNTPTNIDPRLVGVTEFTKPKSRFWGALQRRGEGEYTEDAIGGLVQYIPQAEYKINIEPIIPQLRGIIKNLKESTIETRNANGFIDYLMSFTNELAGKTNRFDRILTIIGGEGSGKGRAAIKAIESFSARMRVNAIVGNVRTIIAQGFNLPNVIGYVQNPVDLTKGFTQVFKAYAGGNEKELLEKSAFLKERYLDRSIRQFDDKLVDKMMNNASFMLEVLDKFVAEGAYLSAYNQAIRNGMFEHEAVQYADDITRKAVAGRGIGEMPIEQKSKFLKLFAPFQVEVRNSVNVIKDLWGEKTPKGIVGIAGIFLTSAIMNEIVEAAAGYEIGLNPFGTIKDSIVEGIEEDKSAGEIAVDTVKNLLGNTVSNIPYGGYVAQFLVDNEADRANIFNEQDPSRFGTGNIAIQTLTQPVLDVMAGRTPDLKETALMLLPRFGGKQIDRTISGLQDMAVLPKLTVKENEDGEKEVDFSRQSFPASYNDSGNKVRFPMDATARNYVTAPLLGSFATKEGKEYLAEGYSPLSEKQTAVVEELTEKGYDPDMLTRAIRTAAKMSGDKKRKIKSYLKSEEDLSDRRVEELMREIWGYKE